MTGHREFLEAFFTLVGGRGGPEKKKGIDRDRVESFLQAYRYGR